MKRSGIYGLLCGGKWYVGQSVNLAARKRSHKSDLLKGGHHNLHLQRTFNRVKRFDFLVVEECSIDQLDFREIFWIASYRSLDERYGFNLESGGNDQKVVGAATRAKLSRAAKGRKLGSPSEETRRKISETQKGKQISLETRAKLTRATQGKPWSALRVSRFSERVRSGKARRQWQLVLDKQRVSGGTMNPEVHQKTVESRRRNRKIVLSFLLTLLHHRDSLRISKRSTVELLEKSI